MTNNIIGNIYSKGRELVMYCMIGCTGATLDFVIYAALTSCNAMHYQLANYFSVSVGIVNNFFLNYYFTFKTRDHIFIRLISFYCIGMFGWLLSAVILWICIEKLNLNVLVAKLCTIVMVTVVQFCFNKFITFKK